MVAQQQERIAELLANHRARLHQLELKQALLGDATPPEVAIEAERIINTIERLSGEPVEMTTRERYLVDLQWQMRIEGDLAKLDRKVDRLTDLVERFLAELALRALVPAGNGA